MIKFKFSAFDSCRKTPNVDLIFAVYIYTFPRLQLSSYLFVHLQTFMRLPVWRTMTMTLTLSPPAWPPPPPRLNRALNHVTRAPTLSHPPSATVLKSFLRRIQTLRSRTAPRGQYCWMRAQIQ